MSEVETVVPLRWSDQDINGHVNNAKIVTVVEESRIQWLNRDAALEGLTTFDCPKVVVSLNVEYRSPVAANRDLHVFLSTERVGRSSFTLVYRGLQDGQETFRARTVLVTLDPDTQSPRALSPEERAYLERHRTPTD